MRLPARYLGRAIAAAAALLAAIAVVRAETWTLELKRLEARSRFSPFSGPVQDNIYRATYPQGFYLQVGPDKTVRMYSFDGGDPTAAFKRIVKKEPKYACECPFRGVARLGSQQYAFALDAVPVKPAAKNVEPAKEKAQPEAPAGSAAAKPKEKTAQAAAAPKLAPYNRLYFDFNHNGDLTDDKIVEGTVERPPLQMFQPVSFASLSFPRIELTIDVDGRPVDYAFFLEGFVNFGGYASISINAAAYREGDITLAGKKHHVALIDFNSNGRFDDKIKISPNIVGGSGQLYPQQGDMLLVDPDAAKMGSPYDVTSGSYRNYVSKLIKIDDRFYDLKISPAGDKLTLTPSSVALGSVTNPNDGFRAVIYGERGFLAIRGTRGTPAPVPEGQWKLLSYTIDEKNRPEPAKAAKKEPAPKKNPSDGSPWQALADAVGTLFGGGHAARIGPSFVSAQATREYKAITVGKGKTVELPFGPPYKPVVTMYPYLSDQGEAPLAMSLVGSAGEVCTNLMVDGGRPSKPEFTITDPQGKVVEQGSFEYG